MSRQLTRTALRRCGVLERVGDVMLRAQLSVPCATAWVVGPGEASMQRGDGHPAADSPMSVHLSYSRRGAAQVQRVAITDG